MQTIDMVVRSVRLIAIILFIVLAAFGAAGVYFFKIHRSRVKEKSIDYSTFKRSSLMMFRI